MSTSSWWREIGRFRRSLVVGTPLLLILLAVLSNTASLYRRDSLALIGAFWVLEAIGLVVLLDALYAGIGWLVQRKNPERVAPPRRLALRPP